MPVYEFVCRGCGHEFEELVIGSEELLCPRCKGRELSKKFSVFSAAGESRSAEAFEGQGSCGTCGDPRGPGACASG